MSRTLESVVNEAKAGSFDGTFGIIDLCIADDEKGKRVFYIINVKPSLYEEYKNKCYLGEEFEPEDYGVVLANGDGMPSNELMKNLSEQYGFPPDFEERVTAIIQH